MVLPSWELNAPVTVECAAVAMLAVGGPCLPVTGGMFFERKGFDPNAFQPQGRKESHRLLSLLDLAESASFPLVATAASPLGGLFGAGILLSPQLVRLERSLEGRRLTLLVMQMLSIFGS